MKKISTVYTHTNVYNKIHISRFYIKKKIVKSYQKLLYRYPVPHKSRTKIVSDIWQLIFPKNQWKIPRKVLLTLRTYENPEKIIQNLRKYLRTIFNQSRTRNGTSSQSENSSL